MNTRILLGDDHTIVRHGLINLLKPHPHLEVVGEAHNGHTTLEMAQRLSPDIVIMDIAMPDLNGIDATRQLTKDHPQVKIIALSMHSGKRFVVEMLKAGARGYLLKDCAFEELVKAIEVVLEGRVYLSPSIADVVVGECVQPSQEGRSSAFAVLSQREREVLQLMAEGNTTKQIALRLHISAKTVEGHRLRLMEKLKIDSVAQLTKYAISQGLTSSES